MKAALALLLFCALQSHAATASSSPKPAPDEKDWALVLSAQPELRDRIEIYTIQLKPLSPSPRYLIVHPTGALPNSVRNLPVLMLLHGLGGDPASWITLGGIVKRIDDAVSRDRLPPCVLVLPEGGNGYWSDWIDGKHPYGTLVSRVLLDLQRRLPVARGPTSTALVGASMGGFGALSIGLRHPEHFGFIAGLSATDMAIALQAKHLRRVYTNVFGKPPDPEMVAERNPIDLVRDGKGTKKQRFLLAWGRREVRKFKLGSERLIKAMRRRHLDVRSMSVPRGRHGWSSTWVRVHPWWIKELGRWWTRGKTSAKVKRAKGKGGKGGAEVRRNAAKNKRASTERRPASSTRPAPASRSGEKKK